MRRGHHDGVAIAIAMGTLSLVHRIVAFAFAFAMASCVASGEIAAL